MNFTDYCSWNYQSWDDWDHQIYIRFLRKIAETENLDHWLIVLKTQGRYERAYPSEPTQFSWNDIAEKYKFVEKLIREISYLSPTVEEDIERTLQKLSEYLSEKNKLG